MSKFKKAFTLVELLIAMAIIGVLVSIGTGSYMNAQLRGRDAQRKSDLKQISHSLELYFNDFGKYPDSLSFGGEFKDLTKGTVYFKALPTDPGKNLTYVYRIVPSSSNQKYQLFAFLENTKDQDIVTGLTISCGSKNCNFAVTSANTSASE